MRFIVAVNEIGLVERLFVAILELSDWPVAMRTTLPCVCEMTNYCGTVVVALSITRTAVTHNNCD